MIRLVYALRRQAHLSLSEFQDYWRDEHGPLVASFQSRLGILRYTQAHGLEDSPNTGVADLRGQMEPPYDGVAEVWWESEERLVEALSSDGGAAILGDEAQFIDLPQSPLWLAHEYPQFSTSLEPMVARPSSGRVKAHFLLRHPTGMTSAAAQRYWLTVHGPLIRSMALALGLLTYQQVHRFETPVERTLRDQRGTVVEPYMGHAEMWFDRLTRPRGPEVKEANMRAAADEANFIDFSRSANWVGKEYVFVDRL